MSHQPERKDKDCLNCGATVQGRYCHICGQENIVTHQNIWGLTRHFVYDIFHFDGKFFDTLVNMFAHPGSVAREYVGGKRMKYLDPIRMYLFTSAVFFFYFFTFQKREPVVLSNKMPLTKAERLREIKDLQKDLAGNTSDSADLRKIALLADTAGHPVVTTSDLFALDSSTFTVIGIGKEYKTVERYDSVQKSLPPKRRDGWIKRKFVRRGLEVNTKYRGDENGAMKAFSEGFLHRLPYLLFFSLPFFALFLKLLYVRRKQFFYSDHAVFTLYHYILSFIVLLLVAFLYDLQEWLHWEIEGWIVLAFFLVWWFYLYKSMRHFYGQARGKTLTKFLLLNVLGFFLIMLLFLIFVFLSIFQM